MSFNVGFAGGSAVDLTRKLLKDPSSDPPDHVTLIFIKANLTFVLSPPIVFPTMDLHYIWGTLRHNLLE